MDRRRGTDGGYIYVYGNMVAEPSDEAKLSYFYVVFIGFICAK